MSATRRAKNMPVECFSSGIPSRAVLCVAHDIAEFEHRPHSSGTAEGLFPLRCHGPSGRADRAAAL